MVFTKKKTSQTMTTEKHENETQANTDSLSTDSIVEVENGKSTYLSSKSNQTDHQIADYDLSNTIDIEGTVFKLRQSQLNKTKIVYNKATREFTLKTELIIYDDKNEKEIFKKTITLHGRHKKKKASFSFQSFHDQESDFSIAALGLCLNQNDNETDLIICDHTVIDLYIEHKGQLYKDQIESVIEDQKIEKIPQKQEQISEKMTPPKENQNPVKPLNSSQDNNSDQESDLDQLTANEGEVQGLNDGYVGHTRGVLQLLKLAKDTQTQQKKSTPQKTANNTSDTSNTSQNSTQIQTTDNDDDDDSDESDNKTILQNLLSNNLITEEISKILIPQLLERSRKSQQASGTYDAGKLNDANSLVEQQSNYQLNHLYILSAKERNTFYATQEMADIVEAMGLKLNTQYNNKIYVGNISFQKGGKLPPSKSHQIGMDGDFGFPTDNNAIAFPIVAQNGRLFENRFSKEKTIDLFIFLAEQQIASVNRIFVDQSIIKNLCQHTKDNLNQYRNRLPAIKNMFSFLQHVEGHGNHFHLRLKCGDSQKSCRRIVYKKQMNCDLP